MGSTPARSPGSASTTTRAGRRWRWRAPTGLTGQAYTELVTLKVAGDPQLHTHVAIPNVVLTEDGRVGALDLQRLKGRVHEFGALYQAYLATNLRGLGVDVVLDEATGGGAGHRHPGACARCVQQAHPARHGCGAGLCPERRAGLGRAG